MGGGGSGMNEKEKREQKRLDKELEMKRKRQAAEMELRRKELAQQAEKQKREHQRELERIKNENEEKQRKWYTNQISLTDNEKNQMVTDSQDLRKDVEDLKQDIKLKAENIQKFDDERTEKLKILDEELTKIMMEHKTHDDLVKDAIKATNVIPTDIAQFLNLVNNGLLFATVNNTIARNKLMVKIELFGESIRKRTEDQLPIAAVFSSQYQKYVEILANEDYTMMNDIVSDDNDEAQEIIDIINKGIVEQKIDGKQELSGREIRGIKKYCLRQKASAEGGWLKQQKDKQEIIRQSLLETSPLLSLFFGQMNEAMKQSQQLLGYGTNLNDEQQKAIQQKEENEKTLKSIEASKQPVENNDVKEESKTETKEDEYVAAKTKDMVIQNFSQNEMVSSMLQCKAINNAAIVKLHVVDSLRKQFEGGKFPTTRSTALSLAETVEDCCLSVVETQGIIRQSVILAKQLLDFKPSNPTNKAKDLWDAVDAGIIDIFKNAIEVSTIAMKYFGFFLQFKSSFEYFLSAHEIQKNVSLNVALEHIHSDTAKFVKFQKQMQAKIDDLRNSATQTIENCLRNTVGADHVIKALAGKEKTWEQAKEKQKDAMKIKYELGEKYNKLKEEKAAAEAELNVKQFELDSLDESIKRKTKYLSELYNGFKKFG